MTDKRPRGRPVDPTPRTRTHIMLSTDLAAKVDLLLTNPSTGAVEYGARSRLIESLLYEWLQKQAPLTNNFTSSLTQPSNYGNLQPSESEGTDK